MKTVLHRTAVFRLCVRWMSSVDNIQNLWSRESRDVEKKKAEITYWKKKIKEATL